MAVKNTNRYSFKKKNIRLSLNKRNLTNIGLFRNYLGWLGKLSSNNFNKLQSTKLKWRLLIKKAYGDLKDKNLKNPYLLEKRLDVLIFRLRWVSSIYVSKQFIKQGRILVNNKIIHHPAYTIKAGDLIHLNLDPFTIYLALEESKKFKDKVRILDKLSTSEGQPNQPLGGLDFLNIPPLILFRQLSFSCLILPHKRSEFWSILLNKGKEIDFIIK